MSRLQQCPCGSGEYPYALTDAFGIFCCYTCEKCEEDQEARYRPEIFTGPYEADEAIDEEDY